MLDGDGISPLTSLWFKELGTGVTSRLHVPLMIV